MRVLVAEDDKALSLFLRKGLELEGNTVECVADGATALERIYQDVPELLVLDLGLPMLDGMDLLRTVTGRAPGMSIMVLTGRAQLNNKVDCLNLGADDYLVKPFSLQELLARCRAVKRRRGESASGLLQHGELVMNRITRTVSLGSEVIDLTAKEFTLLEYLLLQRGRAVSRQELLKEVWHMAPDTGTNVVDVYVNYLRRKLGTSSSASSLIETVRGEGYAIGARTVPSKAPARALDGLRLTQVGAA